MAAKKRHLPDLANHKRHQNDGRPRADADQVLRVLQTHRPPKTETQREYVDRAVLLEILKAARKSKPKCLHLLESLAQHEMTGPGFYTCSGYRTCGLGRFYAKGASVQHLPRRVRALLCRDAVGDVDFERCAPTICLALCDCLGLAAPELEQIVVDRDGWMARTGCDKGMISKLMNGYSQQRDTWHDGARALREEMRILDDAFFASDLCKPIRAALGDGYNSGDIRRVAVDTLEDCALSVTIATFERAGSLCVGRIFDGAHQLKRGRDGEELDLDAIAVEATEAATCAVGFRVVARVKAFEVPKDAAGHSCETVAAAVAADSLFALDEHPRPGTPDEVLVLIGERFGEPWFVVAPSDEERLVVVRDMDDGTWSLDKYALKEYAKALSGELGINPRRSKFYDDLADFAAKDASHAVPIEVFRGGYMMQHGSSLLPFAHGLMLNLDTGEHGLIKHEQRVWRSKMLDRAGALLAAPSDADWMPRTYAINASTVVTIKAFDHEVLTNVAVLLRTILGPLLCTVLDRVAKALFDRRHARREFIVLSGTGGEGKSLLFALLRMIVPGLVVKAEALIASGKRGLNGNNESWHKAKDAAIVVTEEVDGELDGNAYKELSGGNGVTISCSKKYGHEVETSFSGLIVLLTNNRLRFKPFDGALAGRMIAAQMPSKFVRTREQIEAAYREKAYVNVYAAFEDELYVTRLFETDDRYKTALLALLYAHYRQRSGLYAPLDAKYDIKAVYEAECESSTPLSQFNSFWAVDARSQQKWTAKDLFETMLQHMPQEKLLWQSTKSLGMFLTQTYSGALGGVPTRRIENKQAVWTGFELRDDHPTWRQ